MNFANKLKNIFDVSLGEPCLALKVFENHDSTCEPTNLGHNPKQSSHLQLSLL